MGWEGGSIRLHKKDIIQKDLSTSSVSNIVAGHVGTHSDICTLLDSHIRMRFDYFLDSGPRIGLLAHSHDRLRLEAIVSRNQRAVQGEAIFRRVVEQGAELRVFGAFRVATAMEYSVIINC